MKATDSQLDVVSVADYEELSREIVELFVSEARGAIESRERFCTAISRDTPGSFFELLWAERRSKRLQWDKIHFFWVDECCDCNRLRGDRYEAATYGLMRRVRIPAANVHLICSKCLGCECAASLYEQTIYNVVKTKKNGVPRFDLIVLRMEADAHIGSLFPDTYAFFDRRDLVRVIYFMDGRHTRITLTNPVLCAASRIAVMVSGEQNAAILGEVLTSERDELQYPIHAIWPVLDKVTWLVDRNASKFLRPLRQPYEGLWGRRFGRSVKYDFA
jgi:6-phosphogluconolactonase